MKSIEISARTVAEAIQLALAQLGKDRDEVAIEVLEAGSADEEALVRVTAVDDDEETAPEELALPLTGNVDQIARRILEDLLERMDIEGYVTAVHNPTNDDQCTLNGPVQRSAGTLGSFVIPTRIV